MVPLPEILRPRLAPPLSQIALTGADDLRACAAALSTRRPPPAPAVQAALDAYAAEIALIRREGLMREMPGDVVERIFALGFALEQLRHNFRDLMRCVAECAQAPSIPPTSPIEQGDPA
jgi:hypothetical protein